MKNIFLVFIFATVFIFSSNKAISALSAGDIAFIGYREDIPDGFTFVTLVDIPDGEVIYFTDQGWSDSDNDWYNNTEAHFSWTAPSGGVSAGTVITAAENTSDVLTANSGTFTLVGGTSVFSLTTSGDALLAYQSTAGGKASAANLTFLTAIYWDDNFAHNTGCVGTQWYNTSGSCVSDPNSPPESSSTSGLPPGLTDGTNAVHFFPSPTLEGASNNGRYVGTQTGDKASLAESIADASNWEFVDDPLDITTTYYDSDFTVNSSTSPEISLIGNSQTITDGDDTPSTSDDTDFETIDLSATSNITYTIDNSGDADLTLDGSPIVDITGAYSDQFSVTTQPTSPVGQGNTDDFIVEFDPTSVGVKSATISIDNDDSDENPYTFAIEGSATTSPEAYIDLVDNIDFESARITADVFNGFVESSVTFNYGETSANLDLFVSEADNPIAANTATFSVSENITGLEPNTLYYYDIYIEANGNATSNEGNFTTDPANAEAYIDLVDNIDFESARVIADLYNGNTTSSASIQIGESTGNYNLTPVEFSGSEFSASNATFSASQDVISLLPNTQYFYRILHENNQNQAQSSESNFTTLPANSEVYLNTVTNIDFNSASITADLYNGNTISSATIQYGLNSGNLNEDPVEFAGSPFAGSTATFSASQVISNLLPNTEYFYAITHENVNNAPVSIISSFTTLPANAEAYSNTVTNITGFSASITFDVYNGNTFSSATIFYGEDENNLTLSQEYSGNNIAASTSTITLSQNLTNLNPTSTYYYKIVNDNVNNSATSSSSSFETGFGNPTIEITSITPKAESADVSFDAFNAELEATITYWVTQTEGVYNGSNSFSYDSNPMSANSSTQSLEQTISNLLIETEYFYYFEIDNGLSSASTTEASFLTLSPEPLSHSSFSQINEGLTSITFTHDRADDNAIGAEGYLIIRKATAFNSDDYPQDGNAYAVNDPIGDAIVVANITDPSSTQTILPDLLQEKSWQFALIPYNTSNNDASTNYLITNAPTISGYTIPTLGEWGMIAFTLLMGIGGVWYARRS